MSTSLSKGLDFLYNQYLLENFYRDFILLFIFTFMLTATITKFSLEKFKPIVMSKENISAFVEEHRLIMKVHHAVNNCWRNKKYIDDCKRLLKNNTSLINKRIPPYGFTPFLRACMYGCVELISFMLDNGADINICTKFGEGPVYLTTYGIVKYKINGIEALDLLVNSGCCINQAKDENYTPLHLAARFGPNNLICWLLINGASGRTPKCRYSPYEYALKYENKSGADILYITDEERTIIE